QGVFRRALVLVRGVGDAGWGPTLLLFLPRWAVLTPLAGLAIVAGMLKAYRHWLLQAVTGLVVAGPLMGLSLPLAKVFEAVPEGERARIATFNLGSEVVDVPALERWLD